jgi:hypothetical protein
MHALAIVVFVNLHADLGAPLFYCVNNHVRQAHQPLIASDDPREIRG